MNRFFALALLCTVVFLPSCTDPGKVEVEPKEPVVPVIWISLDKTSINMVEGQSLDLIASISPSTATNKSVTWSSDKPEVATVDVNGSVKAIAVGESNIKVVTADGDFSATCKVTVTKLIIPVTDVSLDKTTANMLTGETLQLSATVAPENATDNSLSWNSDKASVATVNASGLVTAISAGTANIKVSSADGKFAAICRVSITKAVVKVTGLTLDKTTANLLPGAALQLVATIAPANADDQRVSWSSDKATVATVDNNGLVKAVSLGTATIKSASADGGFVSTCVVTVSNIVVPTTGISLNKSSVELTISQTTNLIATLTPSTATDLRVVWSSDNTSIATVDDRGLVRAVGAGVAIVKALSVDGGFSATCSVVVSRPAQVSTVDGEWKLAQWAASPSMEGKIWMVLNANKTFDLYQMVDNHGFAKFSGTYTHDAANSKLSGVYSDGIAWARSYNIDSVTTIQMILTDSAKANEVSIYDRQTVPDYVKDGVVGATRSIQIERFL